jgi:ribosomal-protein-alanine N-acetyltransferase
VSSIRPATAADLPAMMVLEKNAATAAHWSIERYEDLFRTTEPNRVALILSEENEVQAFVVARVVRNEWEIENIAVAGAARRRGRGMRLLGDLLDMARTSGVRAVFLEVRESNRAARALYEKLTFVEHGRRRRYYQEPDEDAILYRIDFI